MQNVVMLTVIMAVSMAMSFMLNGIFAECRNASKLFMLSVVMLSVIMLSLIVRSIVMLNVVAPFLRQLLLPVL